MPLTADGCLERQPGWASPPASCSWVISPSQFCEGLCCASQPVQVRRCLYDVKHVVGMECMIQIRSAGVVVSGTASQTQCRISLSTPNTHQLRTIPIEDEAHLSRSSHSSGLSLPLTPPDSALRSVHEQYDLLLSPDNSRVKKFESSVLHDSDASGLHQVIVCLILSA